LPYDDLVKADFSIYLGNYLVQGDQWGEYLYLVLNGAITSELREILDNHPQKVSESDGIYTFAITDKDKETIVSPFLKGKYSEIDRDYVAKNFPNKEYIGTNQHGRPVYKPLVNYKILTKDPSLKEWWEEKYGLALPEGAEVWSRPEPEDEIMYYPKHDAIKPENKPARVGPSISGDNGERGNTGEEASGL